MENKLSRMDDNPTPEISEVMSGPPIENIIVAMSADVEKKAQAYALFLSTNQTPEEIGLSLALPGFLIRHWIGTEKWAELKASVQMQVYKKVELEYQELVSTHRLSTARRHLMASKRLEDEVNYVLEVMEKARESRGPDEFLPKGHDMTLVRLSQALKNATDVSARVVGISDKPPLTEADAAKTIIMIGGRPAQSVRMTEKHKSTVIDITDATETKTVEERQ